MFETLRPNSTRTEMSRVRIEESPHFAKPDDSAPYGYYQNGKKRHIIGRCSTINGGVYLGKHSREAIVVDSQYDRTRNAYIGFSAALSLHKIIHPELELSESDILNQLNQYTQTIMPYDAEKVQDQVGHIKDDHKYSLCVFLQIKGGVCRHQALLNAFILEKLIKDNFLNGTVSVERNEISGIGAHAWASYTNPDGEKTIIDSSIDFVGPIEDAIKLDKWNYQIDE